MDKIEIPRGFIHFPQTVEEELRKDIEDYIVNYLQKGHIYINKYSYLPPPGCYTPDDLLKKKDIHNGWPVNVCAIWVNGDASYRSFSLIRFTAFYTQKTSLDFFPLSGIEYPRLYNKSYSRNVYAKNYSRISSEMWVKHVLNQYL